MKNSPHHRKHLQHKALRAASHIQLGPHKKPKTSIHISDDLRPLNIKRCIDILNLYKKHLTNPVSISFHENHPNKIIAHCRSSDMEKSKRIARKMLKQNHQHYKKAA